MKYSEKPLFREGYAAPAARVVDWKPELSFLRSNTEPIDDDDPEIDW